MLDFQGNLNGSKQNTSRNLEVKVHYYKEDNDDYHGCNVCVDGNSIPRRQINEDNGEDLNQRLDVFNLVNSDAFYNAELRIMDNEKELKRMKLRDILHFEKDGLIEVCVDSEGRVHPKKKKIIVNLHYMREDGNFEGWDDVHIWMNKNEGSNIELKRSSNCRVAQFEMDAEYSDIMGFVIRKNKEWNEKEWGNDRFVNLRRFEKDGVVNIYVISGRKEVFFKPPVILNFHYRRYSSNYDGWDIWLWVQYKEKGCGKGFPVKFHRGDNYGACAKFICDNLDEIDKIGFLVRKSDEKNWKEIDMEYNRYIEVDQLKDKLVNGVADIYLAENDLKIGYDESEMNLSDRIVDAKFKCEWKEIKDFYVELNTWLDIDKIKRDTEEGRGFKLIDQNGKEVPRGVIQGVGEARDDNRKARAFRINLAESVKPIDNTYKVTWGNGVSIPVSTRTLYNHRDFKKKCIYKLGVKRRKVLGVDGEDRTITEFRAWAPSAEELELCVYDSANGGKPEKYQLENANFGMWYLKVDKDLEGKFYTYEATINSEKIEVIDSYAKVTDKNRKRGVVVNLRKNTKELNLKSPDFDSDVFPVADELGVQYTKEGSNFRIWAPTVDDLELCLYDCDVGGEPIETHKLSKSYGGTWHLRIDKDLKGKFYTYRASLGNKVIESVDPCARAAGVNCERGAIIDFKDTNPEGWEETPRPKFDNDLLPVIHEINVRDYTIDKSSGVPEEYRGKFKGLTIKGTKTKNGISTCLDHIKEMGYTHVQIMPVADFGSVDESIRNAPGSYWGYDTIHWFVIEGSYSTNPHDPVVRIKEFKEMIQTFHKEGIGVIVDVVFNHTHRTQFSPFNIFAPDYFYRIQANGEYSKATGCSNEIASEKEMVRKYIVDAIKYWVKEFRVDGFRFDVMYLLDIDTMNAIRKAIDEIDPNVEMINSKDSSKVWVYGEGWTPKMETMVPLKDLATKENAEQLQDMGFFDNDFGSSVKSDFDNEDKGFATEGGEKYKYKLQGCIESDKDRANQIVNYVSVHDNLTWWDKICKSFKNVSDKIELQRIREYIYMLGYSIIFTRPGLTVVAEGDEFLRSKNSNDNSYDAGDEINSIKWEEKIKHLKIVKYLEGLIKMKKAYSIFSGKGKLNMLSGLEKDDYLVGYSLEQEKDDEKAVVIHNGGWEKREVIIPEELGKEWSIIANSERAGAEEILEVDDKKERDEEEVLEVKNNKVVVLAHSSKVLINKKSLEKFRQRKKKLEASSEREQVTQDVKVDKILNIPRENGRQREFVAGI